MTACATLWIGDRLGAVERACLRSALAHGHRVALYAYRQPEGVPAGVELRDAAEVLPAARVFRHRRGSIAPFSDWFRYELQRRGLGTWIDTDVYLLAPLDGRRPSLFGEQEPGLINNAILRLPPDSPMLPLLLGPFEKGTVPGWLKPREYWRARWRRLITGRADFSAMPWGATGPGALSAVAAQVGLIGEALPASSTRCHGSGPTGFATRRSISPTWSPTGPSRSICGTIASAASRTTRRLGAASLPGCSAKARQAEFPGAVG